MKRDRETDLMRSAEERTTGYLRAWMKNPQFRQALLRPNPVREDERKELERLGQRGRA
jgi:hypothetical protein